MLLNQHLQVNSKFFYTQSFDLTTIKYNHKKKIKFKKLSQSDFDMKIEDFVFTNENEIYIHIKTKYKGEFLLTNVTFEINKNDAIEILTKNAKNQTVYLFDNVDYFSYGRFAIANNEKIERYLSFNSEVSDDENIVEWIGKPHSWEYETHTFFTKKKLEDFEMSFDSDVVCEMSEYYLPFMNDDLQITEITLYSKDEVIINNKKKVQKETRNTLNLPKIYDILQKSGISFASITLSVTNNCVIFSDHILRVFTTKEKATIDDKILSSNKMEVLWTMVDNFKEKFLDKLFLLINDIQNATITNLITARAGLLEIDKKVTNPQIYYIHFIMKNKKKYTLVLTSKSENHDIEHKLGNKLNLKTVDKILNLINLKIDK